MKGEGGIFVNNPLNVRKILVKGKKHFFELPHLEVGMKRKRSFPSC